MKKHIKTIWLENEAIKDKRKEELNSLGFYCLTVGSTGLEVYVLEENKDWLDKLTEVIFN